MAIQKNKQDYRREAKIIVDELDVKIDDYVKKELVPMLLPVNSSDRERNQLAKLLTQIVALDVYKDKLIKTYDLLKEPDSDIPSILVSNNLRSGEIIEQNRGRHNFEFLYQDLADKVERILDSKRPKISPENHILRLKHEDSPYTRVYHCPEGEKPFYKTRQLKLLHNYANCYRKTASIREFRGAISVHHQIKSILELREFYHNHGSLEDAPLHTPYYEEGMANKIYASLADFSGIEYQVRLLRNKLIKKQTYLNSNSYRDINGEIVMNPQRARRGDIGGIPFSEEEFQTILLEYAKGCKKVDTFLGMTRIREISKKMESKKEEKRIQETISEVINLFEATFSNLPEDVSMHSEVLEAFYEKMERQVIANSKDKDCFEKISRCKEAVLKQYNEWMKQDKVGTLDKKLSFHPEDKKIIEEKNKEKEIEEKMNKKDGGFILGVILVASVMGLTMIEMTDPVTPDNLRNHQRNVETQRTEDLNGYFESSNVVEDNFDKTGAIVFAGALAATGVVGGVAYSQIKKIREENQEIKNQINEINNSEGLPSVSSAPRRRRRQNFENKENGNEGNKATNVQPINNEETDELQQANNKTDSIPRRRRRRPIQNDLDEI